MKMEETVMISLCHSLAKAINTGARLFDGERCIYYYSVYHVHPDPAGPYLYRLLGQPHEAGVITTPLGQFFGYLRLEGDLCVVIGPSRAVDGERKYMEELLFLLDIPENKREDYERRLLCAPAISLERISWLLAFVATALKNREFPVDRVNVEVKARDYSAEVQAACVQTAPELTEDPDVKKNVQQSYLYERVMTSFIENGQVRQLEELFEAPPTFQAGEMSHDTLRQIRDTGICATAVAARAAISGGVDPQTAFHMSDLYIQKIELLADVPALERLQKELLIDFARLVRQVKYRTGEGGKLFEACADYVFRNIYAPIRVEELARELGYARSYLCSRFKKQTGLTLNQYILQEKVLEAQRMLQFTDRSLCDIAALFSFSSQSHFQTVFKKVTGETPMVYRQRTGKV